jgi:hypothetical protein
MLPEIVLSPTVIMWITALLSITAALATRDLIATVVAGLLFWFNSAFDEGGHVYIDGEKAVIVKLGLRMSVFRIENGRGETWRYVYNDRIKFMKLEKVIIPKEKTNAPS